MPVFFASILSQLRFLSDSGKIGYYPYKPARLVKAKSGRWYVVAYAWSVADNALKRLRDFLPTNLSDKAKEEEGEIVVMRFNLLLSQGYIIKAPVKPSKSDDVVKIPADIKLLDAYDLVLAAKKGKIVHASLVFYQAVRRRLAEWLSEKGISEIQLTRFSELHALEFLAKKVIDEGLSAKSYNHHRACLATVFNFFVRRKLMQVSPLLSVEEIRSDSDMHPSYSKSDLAAIKAYLLESDMQLFRYIQFLFYTLARPNEVRNLQVKHINLLQKTILIEGKIAKNRKSMYVKIPKQLTEVIYDMELDKYAPDCFLFTASGLPGPERIGVNYFYKRHKKMLSMLGLAEKKYTLYGYKHTAVTALYEANVPIRQICEQCRHSSEAMTRKYLRQRGLFKNDEIEHGFVDF